MLAGLLFATHDADDRPGTLTATLPFGGVTLIEHQARLLAEAGAGQIVIAVTRLTPDLIAAINRIARRPVGVDVVRSVAEAAEKLHPLARVVMLADGITTTPDVVAALAAEGGDALLVVPEDEGAAAYERIGGGMSWAGVARLDPRRIAELAALPRDYDMQSTLVRLASQAQAAHVLLPAGAAKRGHGVDHREAVLAVRSRAAIAAAVDTRGSWFDRLIVAPLARFAMPRLGPRHVPVAVPLGTGMALGLIGIVASWFGHPAAGTLTAMAGTLALMLAELLAAMRDEPGGRAARIGAWVLPALAALAVGRAASAATDSGVAEVLAIGAVVAAALAERAMAWPDRPLWWGDPRAYLALLTLAAVAQAPVVGLALAAGYAAATLAAAIERLRYA